jgi:hypothetical protein
MALVDNDDYYAAAYVPKKWAANNFDYEDASTDAEETKSYGPGNIYQYNSPDSGGKPYGNGFIQIMNLSASQDFTVHELQMTELISNKFLDEQTACLTWEFVTFNPYVNFFSYIEL